MLEGLAECLHQPAGMSLLELHASALMSSPVTSVPPDMPLDEVHRLLVSRRISSVPVVGNEGEALGVISTTDLLRVGRLQPAVLGGVQSIELPNEPVSQHMHVGVISVAPDKPIAKVAEKLLSSYVHRVFVQDAGRLVGVLSLEDLLPAVRALRIEAPLADHMTTQLRTIALTASLAEATAQLDHAGVQGLVVVDEHGHAAGSFTQTEALACRDLLPDTQVEVAMTHGALSMHPKTPLYRAAAAAYEARAKRVLAVDKGELVGLVSGFDFARALTVR